MKIWKNSFDEHFQGRSKVFMYDCFSHSDLIISLIVQVSGRVIVDVFGYRKFNPGYFGATDPLESHLEGDEDLGERVVSDLDPSGRYRFDADEKGRLDSREQELSAAFMADKPEYLLLI